MNLKHVLGLAAAASLALPAVAGAHGTVYTMDARTVPDASNPTTLAPQTRYVVSNHGFTFALRESNSATTRGMVNYGYVPGPYRNQTGISAATRFARIEEGDTGAQPHATCRGVAALNTQAAIEAWQASHENPGGPVDPFYLYVPFQTTSAGLEDDPATWLPVLEDLVGVTADEIDTPAEAQAACTGLGGTYAAADAIQTSAASLASGTVEAAVTPLEAEIALLEDDAAKLNEQLNAALAAKTAAEGRPPVTNTVTVPGPATPAPARPLALTPAGRAFNAGQVIAQVTGATSGSAKLAVTVSEADRKKLGLKSRTVFSATSSLGTSGAKLFVLTASKSAKAALRKARKATPVTLTATLGSETDTAKASLR